MNVFQRIKEIREYRHLSQEEVGSWFGITKQAWGKNEKGESKGLGPAEIETFLQKTNMSAAYLFGESQSLEECDLTKTRPKNLATEVDELKELLQRKLPDYEKKDPLYPELMNQDVRDIVQCLKALSPDLKKMVKAYCKGLHDFRDYESIKKRNAS